MTVWTHGRWTVKPGREEEFGRALDELRREVTEEFPAASSTFLRDRDHPNVFLTFGSWESLDEIERFREFLFPRLGPVRELLEDLEVFTLDEVAQDG